MLYVLTLKAAATKFEKIVHSYYSNNYNKAHRKKLRSDCNSKSIDDLLHAFQKNLTEQNQLSKLKCHIIQTYINLNCA